MSDSSLYSIVSSVLAVYDIKSPLDDFGKPKELKADYTSGFLSYVCSSLSENRVSNSDFLNYSQVSRTL